jgi:aerobic-type carbon monoxide dehydrogenase small subunit (CoxS/CutS family)
MDQHELHVTVNGESRLLSCEPDAPLLDVLRHELGLSGPRFGCGLGLCGACFVLIDGEPWTRSSRPSSTSRPPSAGTARPAWW